MVLLSVLGVACAQFFQSPHNRRAQSWNQPVVGNWSGYWKDVIHVSERSRWVFGMVVSLVPPRAILSKVFTQKPTKGRYSTYLHLSGATEQ